MNIVLHTQKQGAVIFSEQDILENALQQKREGIKPHYCFNYGKGEKSSPGYLIYSTIHDGAGVFLLNNTETDGILLKGLQGDFIYC